MFVVVYNMLYYLPQYSINWLPKFCIVLFILCDIKQEGVSTVCVIPPSSVLCEWFPLSLQACWRTLRDRPTGYRTTRLPSAVCVRRPSPPNWPSTTAGRAARACVPLAPHTSALYPSGAGTTLYGCALSVRRRRTSFDDGTTWGTDYSEVAEFTVVCVICINIGFPFY